MSQSIREKWCEKEISDLDYIRHLEAENAKIKEPKMCEGCKHRYGCEIKEGAIHYLSWKHSRQCSDLDFGCIFFKPKEQQ